jgi:plasmid stabilization system protein ParE
MRRFDELFDLLRRHPLAGQEASELGKGLRSLKHRSHRILYQVNKDEILIVRVLHHAMAAKSVLWGG